MCVFSVTGVARVEKVRYDKPIKDIFHLLRTGGTGDKHAISGKLTPNEQNKLRQLADFIQQATRLDPQQRATCEELLKHPFIVDE